MLLTAVQMIKPTSTHKMALLLPERLDLDSGMFATIPAMTALAASETMINASRTITAIETGKADDLATQKAFTCGLVNPTRTPPATNRAAISICDINWPADVFPGVAIAHSRYCSTANRPSWSNAVEKIKPTWHAVVPLVVSMSVVIKST
jgi:hypothetical protein